MVEAVTPGGYELGDEETWGLSMSKVNRPGCWINMIPANGMVIISVSSSGGSVPNHFRPRYVIYLMTINLVLSGLCGQFDRK